MTPTGDAWGSCPSCGEHLCRENASRLRSGAVVHVGCQGGRVKLAAALRKGDAELPDTEPGPVVQNDEKLQAAVAGIREAFGVDPTLPVGPADPDYAPKPLRGARRKPRGGPPGGATSVGPLTVKVEGPAFGVPLVQASGPADYEALGRERYRDTPEAGRAAQLPRILEQTKAGTPEPDRRFADGWLAEHHRAGRGRGLDIDVESPSPAPARPVRRRISLGNPSGAPLRAGFDGLSAVVLAVQRAPDGAINNCAIANGEPESDCQMCPGKCPDRSEPPMLAVEEAPKPETRRQIGGLSAGDAFAAMGPRGLAPFLSPEELPTREGGLDIDVESPAPALAGPPPELVHMIVPGFPERVCCGKEAAKGAPRLKFTANRPEVTCLDCTGLYDNAEALADLLSGPREEAETDVEKEARESAEERGLEAAERKARDAEQAALLADNPKLCAPPPSRPPGTLVHLFDGWPEVRAVRSGYRQVIEARCGALVRSLDAESFDAESFDAESFVREYFHVEGVSYIYGHFRCCRSCGDIPQPVGARTFGAFVSPDRIVQPGAEPAHPLLEERPRQGLAPRKRRKR